MGQEFLDMHYSSSFENIKIFIKLVITKKHIISVSSKQFNAWNLFVYTRIRIKTIVKQKYMYYLFKLSIFLCEKKDANAEKGTSIRCLGKS